MKVLILVILFTLCSAQELDFFKTLLKELQELRNAADLSIVNDTQLPSMSDKHPCECEVEFVKNLNKSIRLINSTSHRERLYNILDTVDSHHSPNTVPPENPCEKKILRKRRLVKVDPVKVYINSSITFIQKWNKSYCIRKSVYRPKANHKH